MKEGYSVAKMKTRLSFTARSPPTDVAIYEGCEGAVRIPYLFGRPGEIVHAAAFPELCDGETNEVRHLVHKDFAVELQRMFANRPRKKLILHRLKAQNCLHQRGG